MKRKTLWEQNTVEKKCHIPAFDRAGLEKYLFEMSNEGLHFKGFGKRNIMVFEKGGKTAKHYFAVLISEISEKSTGEFLSRCEEQGLRFIDRRDRDDLFIFEATGETDAANELLQSRDHYRTRKMGIVYTLLLLLAALLTAFSIFVLYRDVIVPYRTDALRYYMHDFYLYGAKMLPVAGICLLLAAAIVFVRFLRRHASETNKRRKDPSARWQAPRWLVIFTVVLLILSLLTGIIGALRNIYNTYTDDEIPQTAYIIDFSKANDNSDLITFEGTGSSSAIPACYRLIWSGTEYAQNGQGVIEKRFFTQTAECASRNISTHLYECYALPDLTFTSLSNEQCRNMSIDAGKYAKVDAKWYLLLLDDTRVYYAELYNMYTNETIDQSLTALIKGKSQGATNQDMAQTTASDA